MSPPWTRRDALAAAALAAAPFAFLWPLFVPGAAGRRFVSGDFVDQFYAFAAYETRSFAAGALPLWNPFAYAGGPFWADVQAAVAYPPSLAVVLLSAALFGHLPFRALELEAVGHLALAAVLTYAFARHVLGTRAGALVAATAFGLGGYLTGYPPLQLAVLETVAWLPLALLGADLLAARLDGARETAPDVPDGNRRRGLLVAAAVLALGVGLAVLAGHPQSALYLLYVTAAWFAWRARPWGRARAGRWLPFLGALALGAGLSAAGWLPALALVGLSGRATADYATLAHGFPPRELAGAVLPGITLWSPIYVGVLALLFALSAAWTALTGDTGGHERFWAGLAVAGLVLALGGRTILFDLAYLLAPGFDLFRGQERAALVVSFALAMLAGAGTEAWLAGERDAGRRLASGAVALAALGLVLVLAAQPALRPAALRLTFLAGGASLLAAVRASGRASGRLLAGLAIGLVALDLYLAGAATNLTASPPDELRTSPFVAALTLGAQRVANEDRLPPNIGVLHGFEATSGASPLRLRTFERLAGGLAERPVRLWDLLAVSHVLTWRDELGIPAVAYLTAGEGEARTVLHALDTVAPYVWRAPRAERVTDDEALARLRDPEFNPLATVLLDDGPEAPVDGTAGDVESRGRSAGEVVAATTGLGPGWLVFSEMHYPGWRATVDGLPAEIRRADVALMAVAVPAGEHEVRLAFHAPLVTAGIGVSLVSALAVVGLLAWGARPRLRRAPRLERALGAGTIPPR